MSQLLCGTLEGNRELLLNSMDICKKMNSHLCLLPFLQAYGTMCTKVKVPCII